MWKQLRALLPISQPDQLTISSHGQETCGIPFEQVTEVMKWLGLSLIAAGYQARAHMVWDSPETSVSLGDLPKGSLRRNDPIFLYRCGDRPMPPPSGYYWRLMSEYPTLRMYQLEIKND
ncbi:MAG: hypothetical protein DCF15_10630 [Phormidesmis priestleyi]|uniref:Uncharacterized protein n=1 Tax=Phormidesmis priestleyi TaxID=268141 RepID=A0A2W4XLR9_9CYAN|nr:MAG: hypothetical protein DCF15_10630 [Phormidesmis priestleyi]